MMFDEQGVLRRFHQILVQEIHARNPQGLSAPFTVAEIYQDLVPYRSHRDQIGVEMSADYEHALIRLLAGEGNFLIMESKTACQEIQEELDSPNPNTGLYREFAAAEVRLNPDKLDAALLVEAVATTTEEEPMDEDSREEEVSMDPVEKLEVKPLGADLASPEGTGAEGEELDSGESLHQVSEWESPSPPSEGVLIAEDAPEDSELPFEHCPWCRENLPQRPGVRFCPFCGSNVRLIPCPACGEELELNWRFCVACGTEVQS